MTTNFDYSLRVKNGAGWRSFDRVRLMVSVGQPYHEGKKLAATVDWINRNPGIREVHVSVNDYLQRHNALAAGLAPEDAGRRSLADGALWLARNADALAAIRTDVTVTRWQAGLAAVNSRTRIAQSSTMPHATLCLSGPLRTMPTYLPRAKMRRGETVPPSLLAHSRDYLIEELAVFAIQCAALPAAEIYPGSNLAAAAYLVAKRALPEEIRPLAKRYFTRVDFSRINPRTVPDALLHQSTR